MYSLKNHHTFGLASHCNEYLQVNSLEKLQQWVASKPHSPYFFLGEGSNCIFVEDYTGTVIAMRILGKSKTTANDSVLVRVGAGENWHEFVSWCIDNKLFGLENLALIPGTVGAAPIQNIGAYGVEVKSFIHSVEVLNLVTNECQTLLNHECQFAYRDSIFKRELESKVVVVAVNFAFPKQWQPILSYGELHQLHDPTAKQIYQKVIDIRQQKLPNPADIGNAGSFFKNPVISQVQFNAIQNTYPDVPSFPQSQQQVKIPAAWLIDKAGFKGQTRGGIQCHPKHALVLTNANNGNGSELLSFAREIVQSVKTQFNVELHNEVRLIGKQGLISL